MGVPEPSTADRRAATTRDTARCRSTLVAAATASFRPAPIEPAWLLGDACTVTEAALVASNEDGTIASYLWRTSRAHYRWEHASDEVVTVTAGEVFLRDERSGSERRLGPGDVAYFPAGARTVWRVPDRLHKVSTLVRPVPQPLAWVLRRLRAAKRAFPRLRSPSATGMGRRAEAAGGAGTSA